MSTDPSDVVAHFTARAPTYDASSRWCTDPALMATLVGHTAPEPHHRLLDVACGTGLVSAQFVGKVAHITGVDITSAMFEQAAPYVDAMHCAPAEALPFEDASFDRVVCRQGIQFMDAPRAAAEMVRVCKPGGRVVLINLCAYGEADREEYFEILRLRNPARRNFFLEADLSTLLTEAGCAEVEVHPTISVEDVDAWSANGAIGEGRREGIRAVYRSASQAFRELHAVQTEDGNRFQDRMLFGIAVGVR